MGRIARGWSEQSCEGLEGHVPHRMCGDCLWGPPFGGFKKVAVVSLFCFIPNLIASGKECEVLAWHVVAARSATRTVTKSPWRHI